MSTLMHIANPWPVVSTCQRNPNSCWNRQVRVPALQPVQVWGYCYATTGQGESFPLPTMQGCNSPKGSKWFCTASALVYCSTILPASTCQQCPPNALPLPQNISSHPPLPLQTPVLAKISQHNLPVPHVGMRRLVHICVLVYFSSQLRKSALCTFTTPVKVLHQPKGAFGLHPQLV